MQKATCAPTKQLLKTSREYRPQKAIPLSFDLELVASTQVSLRHRFESRSTIRICKPRPISMFPPRFTPLVVLTTRFLGHAKLKLRTFFLALFYLPPFSSSVAINTSTSGIYLPNHAVKMTPPASNLAAMAVETLDPAGKGETTCEVNQVLLVHIVTVLEVGRIIRL